MARPPLARAINPKQPVKPVGKAWGVVHAVHTNSAPATVDVYVNGSTICVTGLRYRNTYTTPLVGDVVEIEVRGSNDVLVVGPRA